LRASYRNVPDHRKVQWYCPVSKADTECHSGREIAQSVTLPDWRGVPSKLPCGAHAEPMQRKIHAGMSQMSRRRQNSYCPNLRRRVSLNGAGILAALGNGRAGRRRDSRRDGGATTAKAAIRDQRSRFMASSTSMMGMSSFRNNTGGIRYTSSSPGSAVLEGLPACRTDQNFQQLLCNHGRYCTPQRQTLVPVPSASTELRVKILRLGASGTRNSVLALGTGRSVLLLRPWVRISTESKSMPPEFSMVRRSRATSAGKSRRK